MTIRLLSTYDGFPPNSVITIDPALEAAFIAAGNATANLTGGVVGYRQVSPLMVQPSVQRHGSVDLTANRKATVPMSEGTLLTITPTAGTTGTYQRYDSAGAAVGSLTVIGTAVLTVGAFEGDFTVEIKCATGTMALKVRDAATGAAQVSSAGKITDSAGNTYRIGARTKRIQNIRFTGDSEATGQGQTGWSLTGLSLPGFEMRGTNQRMPAGSVAVVYNGAAKTIAIGAPGDSLGTPVAVTDGCYRVYSANGIDYVRIGVTSSSLSGSNISGNLTLGNARLRRSGWAYAFDAFTNCRFTILKDAGIGGNAFADFKPRIASIIAGDTVAPIPPDLLFMMMGTNDATLLRTGAQINVDRVASWDAIKPSGIPLVDMGIMARMGLWTSSATAGTDGAAIGTVGPIVAEANRLGAASAAAQNYTDVQWLDTYSKTVDSSTGRARDYMMNDGLHQGGSANLSAGEGSADIVNRMSPDTRAVVNPGNSAQYNATYAPGGNLLTSNKGSMAGSGGTAGTGISLTPIRINSTAYAKNFCVIVGDRLYRAVIGGTAGTTAPTHTAGDAVDGTVTWRFLSSGVWNKPWAATTVVDNVDDIMVTAAGLMYQCVTPGTTSGTAPTTRGAAITDGSVTWKFLRSGVVGTGIPASYAFQRHGSGTIVGQVHRVTATDGGADWVEIAVSGSTTDPRAAGSYEQLRIDIPGPNLAVMNDGDFLGTFVPMQIVNGTDNCLGVWMDQVYTGLAITHDNLTFDRCMDRGFTRTDPFTIGMEPVEWVGAGSAVISAVIPRVFIQSMYDGVFRFRIRSVDLNKTGAPT